MATAKTPKKPTMKKGGGKKCGYLYSGHTFCVLNK